MKGKNSKNGNRKFCSMRLEFKHPCGPEKVKYKMVVKYWTPKGSPDTTQPRTRTIYCCADVFSLLMQKYIPKGMFAPPAYGRESELVSITITPWQNPKLF